VSSFFSCEYTIQMVVRPFRPTGNVCTDDAAGW